MRACVRGKFINNNTSIIHYLRRSLRSRVPMRSLRSRMCLRFGFSAVYGGRPALRPFAAAPRPVASARRPAPRTPLRYICLCPIYCVCVHRLCVYPSSVCGSFGGRASGASWARYARSALNAPSCASRLSPRVSIVVSACTAVRSWGVRRGRLGLATLAPL